MTSSIILFFLFFEFEIQVVDSVGVVYCCITRIAVEFFFSFPDLAIVSFAKSVFAQGLFDDDTTYNSHECFSYEDYWVTAGKRYYYTVVAYLSNGAAITSNEFAALSTTPAPTAKADTVLRKTIRITSIRYVQNKGIELKWQDMGKGVTYSVYRRWAKADQFSKIADVGSAVTYLDTFPHKGGYVYYYYIVAEDQYGYTIVSETQHAQVQ